MGEGGAADVRDLLKSVVVYPFDTESADSFILFRDRDSNLQSRNNDDYYLVGVQLETTFFFC